MESELRSKVAATIKAYPNQPGCADTVIALCREAAKAAIAKCYHHSDSDDPSGIVTYIDIDEAEEQLEKALR